MTDRRTVQLVVLVLGIVTVSGMVLAGLLSYQGKPIPDVIAIPLGTALGAVAGLLAKTSSEPPP